ncbi:MAG: hypothetical protein U9N41_08845 [Euryarchaeota archaeon]|nr:hypothetical protein [Euryarchaeota archaeon]
MAGIDFETFEIAPKEEHNLNPIFELDYKKLDLIEENRKGNLNLKLELDLHGVSRRRRGDGTFDTLQVAMADGLKVRKINVHSPNYHYEIVIPQSIWVEILEKLDYGKFKIIEMVIPTTPSSPQLATQIDLGSLGQSNKPNKSKRIEDIRQKIWTLLHIGPHEGYIVTRQDAELIIFLCISMIRFYSVQFEKISANP